jgi:hypothetical protein
MAKLTRFQIGEQSDDTFFDNSTGGIVPENHRIFNNDLNESFANLKDSNTFEGENTFQDTIQGDGGANFTDKVTMFAQFVTNQVATEIASDTSIDLTTTEGNIIFISGNYTISYWAGNVGSIFYATFQADCLINHQGGAIVPDHSIQMKGGDTLIFKFESTTAIRILGLRRYAGDFFQLNSLQDFQDLIDVQALQIGAFYLIPQGYTIDNQLWDILFFARKNDEYDPSRVQIRYGEKAFFYSVEPEKNDPQLADMRFRFVTNVGQSNGLDLNQLIGGTPDYREQYNPTSTTSLLDFTNSFYGDIRFDEYQNPILRNIMNIKSKDEPYFGRYLVAPNSDLKFYPHSGGSFTGWGNNPYGFEDGINYINLGDIQIGGSTRYNNTSLTSIQEVFANYNVVNDNVTINFTVTCQGKFILGASNHEFQLYFPLPFILNQTYVSSGFASVRNRTDDNFADCGALVDLIATTGADAWFCLLTCKHSNTINTNKYLTISGSFTYQSVVTISPS